MSVGLIDKIEKLDHFNFSLSSFLVEGGRSVSQSKYSTMRRPNWRNKINGRFLQTWPGEKKASLGT